MRCAAAPHTHAVGLWPELSGKAFWGGSAPTATPISPSGSPCSSAGSSARMGLAQGKDTEGCDGKGQGSACPQAPVRGGQSSHQGPFPPPQESQVWPFQTPPTHPSGSLPNSMPAGAAIPTLGPLHTGGADRDRTPPNLCTTLGASWGFINWRGWVSPPTGNS